MLLEFAILLLGIALLVKGSDVLVDSVTEIAIGAGVPLVVISLSVVALSTSLPELVVGVDASLQGAGQVALGDVIGANISNICLILGISAIIRPLSISRDIAYKDIAITIAATAFVLVLSLDGTLDIADGILLLGAAMAYFGYVYYRALREKHAGYTALPVKIKPGHMLMLLAGMAMALLGGKLTVDSAVSIASELGISAYIIGITVIALGTTLPELTTGVIASLKGKGDVAIGNSLGSVCLNYLLILGICAVIRPLGGIPVADLAVSLIACALLVPMVLRGFVLARWEGTFLVLFYIAYIFWRVYGTVS